MRPLSEIKSAVGAEYRRLKDDKSVVVMEASSVVKVGQSDVFGGC
jgi:hypothetical protein